MAVYFRKQYLEYFNKFLDQLLVVFVDKNATEVINSTMDLSDDDKFQLGCDFVKNMTDDNFTLFTSSKLKTFSDKNESTKLLSESFFGSKLTLKQLLNKQTPAIKKTIWAYLHVFYLYISLCSPVEDQKITQLESLYKLLNIENPSLLNSAKSDATQKIYDLLNVEVNTDTQSMIDDIVKSFDPLLAGAQDNPVASIMQISQMISTKYADKINSGEIELEKLMDAIKSKVPGMADVLNNFANKSTPVEKEKIIINENYSTSIVDVGENEDNKKSTFNIGNILKAANNIMPNMANMPNMPNMPNMANMSNMQNMPNMPSINDMLKLMNQLQDPSKPINKDDLEKQMSNMGINIKDINKNFINQ